MQLYFVQLEARDNGTPSHVTKLNILIGVNQSMYDLIKKKNTEIMPSDFPKNSNSHSVLEGLKKNKDYLSGFILVLVGGLCLMVFVSCGIIMGIIVCGKKQQKWKCLGKKRQVENSEANETQNDLIKDQQRPYYFQLCSQNTKPSNKIEVKKQHFADTHQMSNKKFSELCLSNKKNCDNDVSDDTAQVVQQANSQYNVDSYPLYNNYSFHQQHHFSHFTEACRNSANKGFVV